MKSRRKSWPCRFYDGETTHGHEATVEALRSGLRVRVEGQRPQWLAYDEIVEAPAGGPGSSVRLERRVGLVKAVEVEGRDFLKAVREQAPEGRPRPLGRLAGLLRMAGPLLTFAACLVAGGFVLYQWVLPALSDQIADRVPPQWEVKLGKELLARQVPADQRCSDPHVADIDAIVARLAAAPPASPYTFKVTVARSDKTVNAFALPGGQIVVYTGLLEHTARPEELAGVLAHEMQHIISRHTTKLLVRRASMGGLLLLAGHAGGLATGLFAASALGMLRYQRQDEEQADRLGMERIQHARVDPWGMVDFFETLEKLEKGGGPQLAFLSDHPLTSDRLAELTRMAEKARYRPVPLLPGVNWRQVATMCR